MTKKAPLKTRFYYGWVMVFIAGFTLFFSGPGQTYSVSMFIDSYINEYGWTRSTVSGMYSLGTLIAGISMTIIGALFDRHGHRKMSTIIIILFGAACLYMSTVKTLPMLLIGFFLIRMLGQGSMSLIGTTLVPQWFIRKRGQALSIVSLFGALSLAVIPPLNTYIIQNYNWRHGWTLWAILLWVMVTPIIYKLTVTRPEDMGLYPDNIKQETKIGEKEVQIFEEISYTLQEALKTRAFWIILLAVIIPSAINTGCTFHQISILGEAGLTPQQASLISGVISIVRLPVVLISGQLADRTQSRYLLAVSQATLLVMLVTLYTANTAQSVIIYGALMGIQMAVQSLVSGVIWPEYYGRKHLSTIRGATMMAGVIGSALGPLPFGYAYDLFGGYREIIAISMVFPLISSILALVAKKPIKHTDIRHIKSI